MPILMPPVYKVAECSCQRCSLVPTYQVGTSVDSAKLASVLEQARHERRGDQHLVITTSAPLEAHQPIEGDAVTVRYVHAVKVLEVAEAGDALVRDLAW